jgi:hypothetical protein
LFKVITDKCEYGPWDNDWQAYHWLDEIYYNDKEQWHTLCRDNYKVEEIVMKKSNLKLNILAILFMMPFMMAITANCGDAKDWHPFKKNSGSHYAKAKSKNPCPIPIPSDPIPEPSSFLLFGIGMTLLAIKRKN